MSNLKKAAPSWCDIHQHHKWCEHNGGVMGETGYENPTKQAAELSDEQKKALIRKAGGIVHGDGNIFFTNYEQFLAAADRAARGSR